MTKTKYAVTLPNGEVATRTTGRTYTHIVAVEVDQVHDRARHLQLAESAEAYAAKYSAPGYAEKHAAEAVAKYPTLNLVFEDEVATVHGWVVAQRKSAEEHRQLAETFVPGQTYWYVAGWCGRRDLAEKLAAKETRPYHRPVILKVSE